MTEKPEGDSGNVHATALVVGETGVLITGPSGSGKSRLAMDFLQAAAAAGRFTALVSDDQVMLAVAGGRVIASAPQSTSGLIELRGTGILRVPVLGRAVMQLAVAATPEDKAQRLPAADARFQPRPGIELPLIHAVPGLLRDPLELIGAFAGDRLLL